MTDQKVPRRRGCFFYGCITGVACLVAILIAGLLGIQQFKKLLNNYTDTKPMPLPALKLTPQQIAQVQDRFDSFRDAVRTGRPTAPLALSADDVNALIASEPEFRGFKDKLYVMIDGDRLSGQFSLPMAEVGLDHFRGRYLNGTGTFQIAIENGVLRLRMQECVVKGKPLPSGYMDAIRRQNLAARVNANPRAAAALSRIASIQVSDGKLIIVPKPSE